MPDTLNRLLGTDAEPEHVESRLGNVREGLNDTSPARQMPGDEPGVAFEQRQRRSIESYRPLTVNEQVSGV